MDIKSHHLAAVCLIAGISSSAQAGSFWFPIAGHYPYSTNLKVTAVPDLDPRLDFIKTRLFETGLKSKGCIADNANYPCNSTYVKDYSVWAYKRQGGGDWSFDGVRYNDGRGGSGKKWLWYDNHRGYDFTSTTTTHPEIYSVEGGSTCGYVPSIGQMCIQHSLNGGVYRTYYGHMKDIPSNLKQNGGWGHSVYRWYFLGRMSNKGTGGVHLHFVTQKLVDAQWVVVDPYGHKPGWPGNTTDDPNNPYLWE